MHNIDEIDTKLTEIFNELKKTQKLGMIISRALYLSINEGLKETETADQREEFFGFLVSVTMDAIEVSQHEIEGFIDKTKEISNERKKWKLLTSGKLN